MAGVTELFPRSWEAAILNAPPPILPSRRFTYPREAEEVDRGALLALVRPSGAQAFLATFALGFADPLLPTGLWSCPHPDQLCAVAGGYAFVLDTRKPETVSAFLPLRPVYQVVAVQEPVPLLLFVGSRTVLAWGEAGELAWQSLKLSDEGLSVTGTDASYLYGSGWSLRHDRERPFRLRLRDGMLATSEEG